MVYDVVLKRGMDAAQKGHVSQHPSAFFDLAKLFDVVI
jgi:hypothetical protein